MKKQAAIIFLVFFLSGCAINSASNKGPNKTLPRISEVKHLSEDTEIGFEWKPILSERVAGYNVYRVKLSDLEENTSEVELEKIATIDDRYASHFVDTDLKPNTTYSYRFSTFSKEDGESMYSKEFTARTKPAIPPIAYVHAVTNLPNRIKLIWRPHSSPKVVSYSIEKNTLQDDEWDIIGSVNGRLQTEYIDTDLNDNEMAKYRVRARTYNGVYSEPSQIVDGNTKALPLMVTNLKASRDLPKKIVLTWDAVDSKDFAYYKIYKDNGVSSSYIAKTSRNTYEDLLKENGVQARYYVTMIDNDGLESPKQEMPAMGEAIPLPAVSFINSITHDDKSIKITWHNPDNRGVKYSVAKSYTINDKEHKRLIRSIKKTEYIDPDVRPGVEYEYGVVSIDKYGLASEISKMKTIRFPTTATGANGAK